MDINYFLKVIADLQQFNVRIDEFDFHYHVFGSWVISFTRDRINYRLIWDGKNRWLEMQSRQAQENDDGIWEEQWAIREADNIDIRELEEKIKATFSPGSISEG